ncbi:MAG TPA: M23 family metallopeptidase [Herpetosiphonaceae bacterium]
MLKRLGVLTTGALLAVAMQFTPASNAAGSIHADPVLGIRLKHPEALHLAQDQYLSHNFGFTLMEGKQGGLDAESRMALRVSWMRQHGAGDLQSAAKDLVAQYPDIAINQKSIAIAGHPAIALYPVPGMSSENTYVYVAANNRLYEVIYGRGMLDTEGTALLDSLQFTAPTQSVEALNLVKADDVISTVPAGAIHDALPKGPQPEHDHAAGIQHDLDVIEPMAGPGCVDWPTWKAIQTPFANTANGNGWSNAGPSFYNEGYHVNCNVAGRLNDYHAIDFRLRTGDIAYSPGAGTVLATGWAGGGWSTLGRVVIIDLGNGYKSLAAHLSSINVSPGQAVTISTVIGYAGGSGNYSDGFFTPHLHQGIYLNASVDYGNRGVYSGQSVEPHNVRYYGNGGGYYGTFYRGQSVSW